MKKAVAYVEVIFTAAIFIILFIYLYQQTSTLYSVVANYHRAASCLRYLKQAMCREPVYFSNYSYFNGSCMDCIKIYNKDNYTIIEQVVRNNLTSSIFLMNDKGKEYAITLFSNNSYRIIKTEKIYIEKLITTLKLYLKNESYGCPSFVFGDQRVIYDFKNREILIEKYSTC